MWFCHRRQKGKRSSSDYCNEMILRLLDPLSQGHQYPFLWHQGPILVPQATGALTSLRCIPQSLSLRVKAFPLCLSPLWALPCIQTEVLALPRVGARGRRRAREREPGLCTRALGLSSSFTKKGFGNTKGVGAGSLGGLVGGKVKFKDALVLNPHITFLNKEAWDTVGRHFCLWFVLFWWLKRGWGYPIVRY